MSASNAERVIARYKDYGDVAASTLRRLGKIRSLLPANGRLLEIGALDGMTVKVYKQKFKGKTFGVDLSAEILKNAAAIIDEVKVCDLDSEALPWENDFFDVVVCSEIIEHINDTDGVLEQIYRVLKPSGTLLISTPNLASLLNRLFLLFGLQPLGTEVSSRTTGYGNRFRRKLVPAGHIRVFTCGALKDMLRAHGFAINLVSSVPMSDRGGVWLVESLAGGLSAGLGGTVIMKCSKTAKRENRFMPENS